MNDKPNEIAAVHVPRFDHGTLDDDGRLRGKLAYDRRDAPCDLCGGIDDSSAKRNRHRFPPDFMFQVTVEEAESLRSQIATIKRGRGEHRKYLPYVFTEHGAIMAASVLNTVRAVDVSVFVVRCGPNGLGAILATAFLAGYSDPV